MPIPEPLPAFDLYAELGIGRAADAPAVESAWRTQMRRRHPDVAGEAATKAAVRLNIAREWLLDPARRARYDAARWPSTEWSAGRAAGVEIPPIDPLGAWPARRRRRPPGAGPIVAIAVMFVLFALTVGLGQEPEHLAGDVLFVLGSLVLGWFALTGVLRLFLATR